MTWRYQIILHDKAEHPWYGLHEVYVGMEGVEGVGHTEEPISFVCDENEGSEGIINSLKMALQDAGKLPVLKESEV